MWLLVVPSWFLAVGRGSALALRSCATNPQFIWVAAHCWGGLVGAHNLYPSSHQPTICLGVSKIEQPVFLSFVQTFTSDLVKKLVSHSERIQNPYPTLLLDVDSVHIPYSNEDIILEHYRQTNI